MKQLPTKAWNFQTYAGTSSRTGSSHNEAFLPTEQFSFTVAASDRARIESMRGRSGPASTGSEAVRAALSHYLSLLPLAEVSAEISLLPSESPETGEWRVWGISLLQDEAERLADALAHPPVGVRRRYSRNEIIRLAVLLAHRD